MKWTENEILYLKNNYKKINDLEIANKLGRNVRSILNKRIKLNLKKNNLKKKTIQCKNCDEELIINSNKTTKYCSVKCKSEYQKKNSGSIRNCKNCGNEFYAKGNPKNRILCSVECTRNYMKTGKNVKCEICKKEVYKYKSTLNSSKNYFCGSTCANIFQKCEKIILNCKICKKTFEVYPSDIKHAKLKGYEKKYCTTKCRNNDPDTYTRLIKMNEKQSHNKNRNKLEIQGAKFLDELLLDYNEQYLVNEKILVDVFIPKYNLIVQWWGDYWHGHLTKIKNSTPDKRQKKRMALDISQEQYLKKCGYNLLCFWEHEVYKNKKYVIQKIKSFIGK